MMVLFLLVAHGSRGRVPLPPWLPSLSSCRLIYRKVRSRFQWSASRWMFWVFNLMWWKRGCLILWCDGFQWVPSPFLYQTAAGSLIFLHNRESILISTFSINKRLQQLSLSSFRSHLSRRFHAQFICLVKHHPKPHHHSYQCLESNIESVHWSWREGLSQERSSF